MKQRIMHLLRAVAIATPLFLTSGCAEDEETVWWLASPWTPVQFVVVTTDNTGGGSGGTGMVGGN